MNTNTDNNKATIEEDEIDLKELFSVIWNNKLKIIIFSFIVTTLTIFYTLSKPNSYTSHTTLIPQGQAKSSLGGLGALAGMAGIDIGGGSELDISTSLTTILNDFSFQRKIIEKYQIDKKLDTDIKNLVFPFNFNSLYSFLNERSETQENTNKDETLYSTYKAITSIISISSDKKSGIIKLNAEHPDRFLAKELVTIYLVELTAHLRKLEMSNVDKQLEYYNNELARTQDINIKEQLSQMISGLVQKKVLSQANTYYNVKQFTKPQVAYIKNKSKPKRGLIVVVSFVTSIILGIFIIFFLEFLKKEDKEK